MFFRRKKSAPKEPEPRPSSDSDDDDQAPTTQFLTGEAGVDRRSVEVLLDAIARVSESLDLSKLLDYIVDTSIDVTGAERGFLILLGDDGELTVRTVRSKGATPAAGEIRFSTSVVRRVLDDAEPVRATVTSESEALELGTSVFDLKLRAVMCVPLIPRGSDGHAERGVLYVDSKAATREFTHKDLSLFAALSQHVSIAMENARLHIASVEKVRLEQSLELASAIQSGLMPKIPKDVPGLDLHGWYQPAEGTSGDFFDFVVRKKDGIVSVVVGDVTGHGIGPALITAAAQSSLRSYIKMLDDLGQVVSMVNGDLEERMDDGMFLTLFLASFDPDGTVRVVNAGHTPPLIWRAATQTVDVIVGDGPAMGMMPDYEYEQRTTLKLEKGDVLLAFTDGFVEARSLEAPDDLFEEAGMRRSLEAGGAAGSSASEIIADLVQKTIAHTGGNLEDDMTVVVVRRTE